MDKIRVMLVDDHAIMRDGIRALLSLHNDIEIVGEASEGQEVVDKSPEMNPDVIIMDIAMKGMDGLEATRRIIKQNSKRKVLILSQHDEAQYVLSAVKAGCAGYMPKRALSSELISAIRAIHSGQAFLYPSAATALISEYRSSTQASDSYDQLTPREREILKLIAEGRSSKEISRALYISIKTVIGHRTKLMFKLGIHNRTELIKYAMRKGLVSID
jgi:DNA-binding NarL/FixJ family response regulator